MFGSCRMCFSPTDKWQDFCNECATRDVPRQEVAPRLRVIRGGKSSSERPGRKPLRRWLEPVASPTTRPPEA
jgi:hypothetical protein